MWAIINKPGAYNGAHIHPGSSWSGVYYVQAPRDCGNIEFIDPRTVHVMNQPIFAEGTSRPPEFWTKVEYQPRDGICYLFPSFLYHAVKENLSEAKDDRSERMIVSFNLSMLK